MTSLEESLRSAVAHLEKTGAEFALVGGLAVSVRTEPRLTRDADFAVAVDNDTVAERVVSILHEGGYLSVATLEHSSGRLATVRLGRNDGFLVDLLFASCGIEPEIVAAAERLEILPQLVVPVATVGHLIAMKLVSRDDASRPNDAADLLALAEIADEPDRVQAQAAVIEITERGFSRGRDLVTDLARLLTPTT